MGDDHESTRRILAGLTRHPIAGAVLLLGLGCENNTMESFLAILGRASESPRVATLVAQEVDDEVEEGLKLLRGLVQVASRSRRQTLPASKLVVGLKCGGSDRLSGITGNPLLGRFSDDLIAQGGSTLLTEVPEMFGAETLLMDRAVDEGVFNRSVEMINGFKGYFQRYGQVVYENPSPGNKDGGISTLEDKSLGCTQKGGNAPVVDVLDYGERITQPGLNLLYGPGNDIVAVTALAAAGAQIVLFTMGRGTPLGAPVPTLKVSTNSELATRKKNWVDFNAGVLVEGESMDEVAEAFHQTLLDLASGRVHTSNERLGYREIAIFKDGVTL